MASVKVGSVNLAAETTKAVKTDKSVTPRINSVKNALQTTIVAIRSVIQTPTHVRSASKTVTVKTAKFAVQTSVWIVPATNGAAQISSASKDAAKKAIAKTTRAVPTDRSVLITSAQVAAQTKIAPQESSASTSSVRLETAGTPANAKVARSAKTTTVPHVRKIANVEMARSAKATSVVVVVEKTLTVATTKNATRPKNYAKGASNIPIAPTA